MLNVKSLYTNIGSQFVPPKTHPPVYSQCPHNKNSTHENRTINHSVWLQNAIEAND